MKKDIIQLSDHFTYGRLLRFTLPSIVMMVFTSIYGVVDGIFVSNFAGKTAFAAINLIMPYLMVFGTLGFMIGTGGTALVSMMLGAGDRKKANETFSLLIYVSIISGVILTLLSILLLRPAAIALGAAGQMLEDCVVYGIIVQLALPAYILQYAVQSFCIAAEKPNLSLGMTVASGVCNIVLDALFVGFFRWGLVGAAVATAVSQIIGGIIPIVYFVRPNDSLLRLGKCRFDGNALLRTCTNGSSELMNNLSMSAVSMLYNLQLIRYAGEDGIAAYGVIMYVNFIFIAIYIGFSMGSAPIVGFNHGAQNHRELKGLLKKSLLILAAFSGVLTGGALLLARPLSVIFVGYDAALLEMTVRAFRIYSLSFLVCGFNIYGSSFFTALNNGLISAAISFLRTLVCQSAAVLLLPLVFGLDGIWWSILAAEGAAVLMTAYCMVKNRKRYHYA
ncbi:MAG: MATE family efflux transporter [Oscillospiraceae bacterium]|nr:MATE family efflux transporter [Oscillospiraceae bacterium]